MKQRSLMKRVSAVLMATALTISTFPQFNIPVFAEEKTSVTEIGESVTEDSSEKDTLPEDSSEKDTLPEDSSEKDTLPEDIPVDTKKELKDDEINNNSLDTGQALDEITVTSGNLTITGNKDNYLYSDGNLTITGNGMFTLSGECNTITIQDSLEVNITASNLTIQSFNTDAMRIGSNTTLNLELVGDNTFSCERTPTDESSRTIRGGTNSNLIIDAENGTSTLSIQGRAPCQDVNIQINGGNIQGAIDIVNDAKQPLYDVDWVLFNESEIRVLTINGKPYNFNYTLNGKSVYLAEPENGYHDVVIKTNESTFTGRLYFNNRKLYYVEVEGDKTIFNGWEISGKHGEDYTIDTLTKTITFLNNGSYDINGRAIETNNVIRFKNGFSGTIQLHDVKSTSENEIISLGENTNVKIIFNGENTLETTWGDKATISTTHQSSSLTFDSNTNGILNVNSLANGVAIGANGSTYNITFNGGIINAKGSTYKYTDIGAGIHNGKEAKNIIVNGGVVNCLTSALGSSHGGNKFTAINAEIIINGGTVTAPCIGGSTFNATTTSVVINGGSVKGTINTLGQLQNDQNKLISLLTVPIYEPVKEILVDGKSFQISSPHDDNNLYLYITQEDHSLTINGQQIEVIWQNASKSFKLKNIWTKKLAITDPTYGEQVIPNANPQFGDVIFTYSDTKDGTYTRDVPKNAGTYYVKATVAETANYTGLESDPVPFEIKKASSSIKFKDDVAFDKVYDTNAVVVTEEHVDKTGSTGTVSFTFEKKVNDNWENVKAAKEVGTYRVTATLAGDNNHASAASKPLEFTISKIDSTVKITTKSLDKAYDGNAVTAPEYTTSGSNGKETIKWQEKSTTTKTEWKDLNKAPSNAGSYRVVVELAGNDKYNPASATLDFMISQATNTWIEKLSITGWTYGQEANDPSAKAQFGDVIFTYSSEEIGPYTNEVPKNAGTWYVKATVAETENYAGLESAPVAFEIAKAIPTYEKVTGLVLGQGQPLSKIELPEQFKWVDETISADELGTHTFKAIYTPEDTANYQTIEVEIEVEVVPTPVELNHVPTISASDKTITVGDKFNPLKGVTANDNEDGDLTSKIKVIKNTVDTKKAGTYNVTYKVADSQGASVTKTIKVTVKAASSNPDKDKLDNDKNGGSVETGDQTNVGLFISLAIISALGIAVILVLKRKKVLGNK